ncbi:MAG: DUF5419 family protein [Gemmatimonadales bacterium]
MKATFAQWMKAVDATVERIVGLSANDLADAPYRDWFDDDMDPTTAARRAVRAAGGGDLI